MAHLIDKDQIATEIEKRRSKNAKNKLNLAASFEDNYLLSFLDTLETKEEIDLEKEIKDYIYTLPHSRTGIPGGWKCSWPEEEVIKIVKHFLGLD